MIQLKNTQVKRAVDRAVKRSQDYFRRTQHPEGYWWGELESNPSMEAEYLMLNYFTGRNDQVRWQKICNYILNKQRSDGSWGQYYE
ncbi:MAG: squalene--hopene cyclase, partial [Chloroflexota bacterium]|nr:squalene--hopene cyclase [Chloroflexota bacterium]